MSEIGHNNPPLSDRLEIDHASLAKNAADALAQYATLDPILTDEDAESWSEAAKALKGFGGKSGLIEKTRVKVKEPVLADEKTIDTFFAKMAKPINDRVEAIVAGINRWQREKIAADEKRQREEAARLKTEATPFDDESTTVPPPPPAPVARIVSAATGRATASASRPWVHRVKDPLLVPRDYLMVDEVKIRAAVKAGAREIAGVEIFQDVQTAIR